MESIKEATKSRILVRMKLNSNENESAVCELSAASFWTDGAAILLQAELLRGVKSNAGDQWRILIVDDVTVKVISSACKLSDVTDENVSRALLHLHCR